jgi:hypothetical protein
MPTAGQASSSSKSGRPNGDPERGTRCHLGVTKGHASTTVRKDNRTISPRQQAERQGRCNQCIPAATIQTAKTPIATAAQTRITMNLPSSLMMQPCPADRAGETPARRPIPSWGQRDGLSDWVDCPRLPRRTANRARSEFVPEIPQLSARHIGQWCESRPGVRYSGVGAASYCSPSLRSIVGLSPARSP